MRESGRSKPKADRRELLLSVGRTLFQRNGYRGVSIEVDDLLADVPVFIQRGMRRTLRLRRRDERRDRRLIGDDETGN